MSVDLTRGLAIVLMLIVNSLARFDVTPVLLKHAPAGGYTIADAVAPMFLFAIGFSCELSFSRRLASYGRYQTTRHFITRYLVLFCIGFFGELLVLKQASWNTLAMIGTVGIYSFPYMFLRPKMRVAVASILFAAYQYALSEGVDILFVNMGTGHPLSTPAWAFTVISASAIANRIGRPYFRATIGALAPWGITLTLSGLLLAFLIPVNKNVVSASYILLSTGLAVSTMLVFCLLVDVLRLRIPILGSLGRNALGLYMLGSLAILVSLPIVPDEASLPYVLLCLGAIMGPVVLLALILDSRSLYVRL